MAYSYFDESYYLSHNADVQGAVSQGGYTSGLQHYQLSGAREMRTASEDFNTAYYSFWNSDAVAAVNRGEFKTVVDHFNLYGVVENRASEASKSEFDGARYLASNADVDAAVRSGVHFRSALDHYLQFGEVESRLAYANSGARIDAPPAGDVQEQSVQLTGIAFTGGDTAGIM